MALFPCTPNDEKTLQYKMIKESTANKTFAQQLAELGAVFNNLPTVEAKMRCVIRDAYGYVFTLQNLASGLFSYTIISGNYPYIVQFDLTNNKYLYIANVGTSSQAVADYSSQTNTYTLKLHQLTYS